MAEMGRLPKSNLKLPTPFEPKKENRWIIKFKNLDIEPYLLQKASRPKFIKKGFWMCKRWEVDAMNIEIIDPIGFNVIEQLYSHLISDSKVGFELQLLDPVGNEIEKWKISDAEILECDFGKLAYANDELLKIKLTIKPKKAILVF